MIGGWNVPKATEKECNEIMEAIKVPVTTKLQITKVGKKFIYGQWICGGEWTTDKFLKEDLLKIAENVKTIQVINRKELLRARF